MTKWENFGKKRFKRYRNAYEIFVLVHIITEPLIFSLGLMVEHVKIVKSLTLET